MVTLLPLLVTALPLQIERVVVYPDRAQVIRIASVSCGAHVAVPFEHLPPAVDRASIRARTSLGTVAGLQVEEHTRADAFAPEVKRLEEQLIKLYDELKSLRDDRRRIEHSGELAGHYTEVTQKLLQEELAAAAPNTRNWDQALETALSTKLRTDNERVAKVAAERELQRRLGELEQQRARLETSLARHEFSAEALVSCAAGQAGKTARVELSYFIGGASWSPSYEARAEEAAGMVELTSLATVQQSSGESWSHAELVLSTAVPRQDATPPELNKLNVWAEEHKELKRVLVRREEKQLHAEAAIAGTAEGDIPLLRATSQGISVQLTVPDPADVAGNGTPVRLTIARHRMKARFALRSAPQRMPYVFRIADLTNQAPFPLLAGPVDAFRDNGLMGHYSLERVAQGARFHLTFGIEEGLRIKRTALEETKRQSGLFGAKHRFRFAYRLELANYLGRSEEVELLERIPVSELDDVEVALETDRTTAGYQLQSDDGLLTWRLRIAPNEVHSTDLGFHVDVPSSYDLGGL